MLRETCM